jgi:hypothetical protein
LGWSLTPSRCALALWRRECEGCVMDLTFEFFIYERMRKHFRI